MSNFNPKLLSDLLKRAKGSRTLSDYAGNAGVDSGYMSKIINQKRSVPPSPEILEKLAKTACNDISYNALMFACGYIEYDNVLNEAKHDTVQNITFDDILKENKTDEYSKNSPKEESEASLDEEESYYVWMLKRLVKDGLIKSEDGIHISNEALELIKSAVKIDAKKIIDTNIKSDNE